MSEEDNVEDSFVIVSPSSLGKNLDSASIEPLKLFIERRLKTIETLKKLRRKIEKTGNLFKVSNLIGSSTSILGGILSLNCPPVGVAVLLFGSATTLGKKNRCSNRIKERPLGSNLTESFVEEQLKKEYSTVLDEDSAALKLCESSLTDLTKWFVTVCSLSCSASKAGLNFVQLSEAINASSTLTNWKEIITDLSTMKNIFRKPFSSFQSLTGKILTVSVIISAADLVQNWISKNANLTSIDKDISLLEQQIVELQRLVEIYQS